jgi:hypothetical protein
MKTAGAFMGRPRGLWTRHNMPADIARATKKKKGCQRGDGKKHAPNNGKR